MHDYSSTFLTVAPQLSLIAVSFNIFCPLAGEIAHIFLRDNFTYRLRRWYNEQ